MQSKDEDLIKSLVEDGLIEASVVDLLSIDEDDNTTIGAIAGAAILATYKASLLAKKSNFPILFEEDDNLVELHPDGTKRIIKALEKDQKLPSRKFTLK